MKGRWVPHDIRDEVIDFVNDWAARTERPMARFIVWLGLSQGKFYDWKERYGKVNEHNGWIPRDFWLLDWEKQAIIDFYDDHRKEGCRRLAFMMLDADVVAVSASSVWRVLRAAGLLRPWNGKESKKGTGFHQPEKPHEHWHIDESMTEAEIEVILQRAKEKHPEATPRIISDNGPQFIAKDFKEFIRISGMTHVKTSPHYPQSNGKIERWHKSLKTECIRPKTPLSLEDARRVVDEFVTHYNTVRLHVAIGYVTPKDMLEGRRAQIHAERDRKLEAAREQRRQRRQLKTEPAVA